MRPFLCSGAELVDNQVRLQDLASEISSLGRLGSAKEAQYTFCVHEHSVAGPNEASGERPPPDQRLEYWVALRALCRPIFFRSTARASRVRKPAVRISLRRLSSYTVSARASPRRSAPA